MLFKPLTRAVRCLGMLAAQSDSEFLSQDPRGGRRKPTPKSPLTSTCTMWHALARRHTHQPIKRNFLHPPRNLKQINFLPMHSTEKRKGKKNIHLKSWRTGSSQFLLSMTFISYYKFILSFAFCDTPLHANRKPMV